MHIDTNAIYICLDGRNGEGRLLTPKGLDLPVFELRLDDADPSCTDAAEFRLLKGEMQEYEFDLP